MAFGPRNMDPVTDLSSLRPIPNCGGYFINAEGEVFCVRKVSQHRCRDGYARVAVRQAGVLTHKAVHTLLATVFLPPPRPDQKEVRHLDGNRQNNAIENLAWGSRSENAQDMVQHGTMKGEGNPRTKLTDSQVVEIRNSTLSVAELAAQYGVRKYVIQRIRSRKTWAHM